MEKVFMNHARKLADADVFWFEKGNPLLAPDDLFKVFLVMADYYYKLMVTHYEKNRMMK